MKHWLAVLISLGFAVVSGTPALAGGAMHGRGLAGGFGGFGGYSPVRVGVPAMRLPPAAPGLRVARHRVNPAPGTAATSVVPEFGGRDEMAPATRSADIRPAGPRMFAIDSSGGAGVLASPGSATAAHPVPRSAGPKILIVSDTIGSRSMGPKIIEVNPATVSKPFRSKVIVVNPSLVSRHRGRTVIGIAEGAQGTILLLGSPCDLGVSWVESCAPVDSALLIVEAAPEDALVFLDGQLLGTAGQLAGQAVVIPAGPHALAIVSPPAEPFIAQFTAKPGTPTRIHVALAAR
jgi:hypothetical protein